MLSALILYYELYCGHQQLMIILHCNNEESTRYSCEDRSVCWLLQLLYELLFYGHPMDFMVALWNTADHYIFILWFLLPSSSFFPRLISAVADWMFTILPRMVWP